MRKWFNVIRIDWHCIASGWKLLGFFLVIDISVLLFGLISNTAAYMIYGAACGMMGSLTLFPFITSQQRGLEGLLALTPTPRRTIVLGHYAFAVTAVTAVVGNLFLVGRLANAVGLLDLALTKTIVPAVILALFFLAVTALQYPILLRFGYDRVTFAVYLPLALLTMILFWFLDHGRTKMLLTNIQLSLGVLIAFVGLFGLSIIVSLLWYRQREL
jgi:hypothetical protein